ncbi:type I restriction-modification system M protein [Streptococcus infantis]|uniref:Type I restriction modification DNA specificity domain protein n=1 Tax=Streptococcus infantis ATCC 700779 TaxID=889204 RepID=E8JZ26_9STRE|nr:type I restriction modification DNA specificity domain protein [Streptococcus infantis ATCC 700779]SUN81293.1 type I restriction-modification system M protein [Streptococcus infantis]
MRIKSIYWNFGQNKPEKFFRYIDTSSIDRKKNIINYKNLQYLSPEQAPSRARKLVSQNSVLFSTVRPYLKNIAVVRELKEYLIASTAFIVLDTLLNETYLKYYLLSDNFINRVNNKSTGTSYPAINDYNFNLLLIAIPPLAEQQRIVEVIESALEKVDEYAESYNRLEQLDKEFPDKLKKSILQYAMQGKLVEQDPNDESVEVLLEKIRAEKQKLFEEGKIKKKDLEISIVSQGDDNSYYEEVPNTWQLFKLKNLLQLDNGTKQQNERLIYWDVKTLRGIKDAEFKEKGNKVHSKDTVILVDGENSGELFIIPHDGYMGSTFKKIHYLEAGSKKYIDLYIDSKKELLKNSKTGSAIPHLNKTLFKELIVALPPIQEQKRISSKITQIFSQINRLI